MFQIVKDLNEQTEKVARLNAENEGVLKEKSALEEHCNKLSEEVKTKNEQVRIYLFFAGFIIFCYNVGECFLHAYPAAVQKNIVSQSNKNLTDT